MTDKEFDLKYRRWDLYEQAKEYVDFVKACFDEGRTEDPKQLCLMQQRLHDAATNMNTVLYITLKYKPGQ